MVVFLNGPLRCMEKRFREFRFCFETLNGRLPPEDGSVRPQTLGKRVSDDSRHFIFRRRKKMFTIFFVSNIVFQHFCQDLGELQPNGPQNQIAHENLL